MSTERVTTGHRNNSFFVSHGRIELCGQPAAHIEFSPVWDTSCMAELIYDLIVFFVFFAGSMLNR